jgi:hypothetical protein
MYIQLRLDIATGGILHCWFFECVLLYSSLRRNVNKCKSQLVGIIGIMDQYGVHN